MRRILSAVLPIALLATLVLLLATPSKAPESAVAAPVATNPSNPTGLPLCTTEDGAGMALCWWDADTMGNGVGTSVVSGDCAPSVMGMLSDYCASHYNDNAREYNYQGATITVPNGADLIRECISQYEGMELTECIKGAFEN